MSDNKKIRVKGSNKRNIKVSYKQGDPNWHKFDAQGFRLAVSNFEQFINDYQGPRYHKKVFFIFIFILFSLVLVAALIFYIIKNYINLPISDETLLSIIFSIIIALFIAIVNFIILFKDRKEYSELERIRKYKPNTELSEKKQKQRKNKSKRKSKKQIKEETPWEL